MTNCVVDLREPFSRHLSVHEINSLMKQSLGEKLPKLLAVTDPTDDLFFQFAKCIWRFQDHSDPANDHTYLPQNRELLELEKALSKAVSKFEKLSNQTKNDLDFQILTRAPFNRRFCFPEQITYWDNNKESCKTTQQKMELVGFAIKELRKARANYGEPTKKSKNEDLTDLIHNLDHCANEFAGSNYSGSCYDVDASSSAEGGFLELVITLLDAFAPKSYHSRRALGKIIQRARDQTKTLKDA